LPLQALALGAGFLWLYNRTAAPSVLSGDSAEFQFAAPLLAVPHPTGYPLYVVLGALFALVPGDVARRVTQVSVVCGALSVMALFLLAARLGAGLLGALLAALALGLSPGLWNAATLAEVYALNLLLLLALALSLALVALPVAANASLAAGRVSPALLALPAFLVGLGISHHSSFLFSGAPLLVPYALAGLRRGTRPQLALLALAGGGLIGLSPWLLPLLQYARYGPFDGDAHGLPRFYFWGAPQSWGEALAHLLGGKLREDAAQAPTLGSLLAVARLVATRLWFEFGPLGLLLGCIGCLSLRRRNRAAWAGSLWVLAGSYLFLALLGPAVQDAPVFTLPIVPVWALWAGFGGLGLAAWLAHRFARPARSWLPASLLLACVVATLAWGGTRRPYSDKAHLWVFRSFGERVLAELAPDAVLITRWEQGTILLYLQLIEERRPDVQIDIVEPGDEPWGARARGYAGRPVYLLGGAGDVEGIQRREVLGHEYASLFLVTGNAREQAQGP
jgi:hypothetical protein